ncbi:hypothetical protein TVAG_487680 [Trichomonas vaginalis G3]|uniref:Vesicle transport v-SNARE N-terminal domain-containing protein n=1 Tax=Trichomonas vaginalis (strain ATCC PRA-98 / G3) TaxID=412133 RepID=A2EFP6_TRIV3|nr:vesicle transport V-SNARE protein family [Trichomonas vaginalis G3]EAY08541.1 hypothetical protein TVAG_487680 [Trichomonas vaginalis G3]KAI5542117.1 vesicle transport V-SNARE protein family [Trichomonas vaginalis G3]|eukprot:XP_001320764.1 hypothetical protein [Trichomonas vaginalis G3]
MANGSRFDALLNQVQSKLDQLENAKEEFESYDLEQKKNTVSRGLRELNQCQNNIMEMDRLVQTMPMRDREFFVQDIATCKSSHKNLLVAYNKLDEEVKRLILIDEAQRNSGVDQDSLNRTAAKLDNANQNLSEAISLGGKVIAGQEKAMNTLAEDRQALVRIDKNVDNIMDETSKANKLANSMCGRACLNGSLAWIIALLLGLVFAALLILRIRKIGPFKKKA